MPPGKKFGGRDFPKGKPGGPGRPKLLPEAVGLPRLDRDSYNRLLNKTLNYTQDQLKHVIKNDEHFEPDAEGKPKKITMLEKWVATIVAKGSTLGDVTRIEALLNRAIGPVKQEIKHEGDVLLEKPQQLIQIAIQMSSNARGIPNGEGRGEGNVEHLGGSATDRALVGGGEPEGTPVPAPVGDVRPVLP